ncbi:MAG: prolyl oligopeptidase PreP (S9A serine peptidase family) [Myxococcota bacterium]
MVARAGVQTARVDAAWAVFETPDRVADRDDLAVVDQTTRNRLRITASQGGADCTAVSAVDVTEGKRVNERRRAVGVLSVGQRTADGGRRSHPWVRNPTAQQLQPDNVPPAPIRSKAAGEEVRIQKERGRCDAVPLP